LTGFPPDEGLVRVAATVKDLPEIDRLTKGIVKVLLKFGGYEPEVDDIWVHQIATCTVYLTKTEIFLDADSATVHTYSRAADTQLKFQKMIENAMNQLALSRRDRIGQQAESDLMGKLRETLEKMKP
jgi:hypothetical protein